MEVIGEHPLVIFDGAHNGAGVAALADSLPEVIGERPLTAVVSILGDKDAEAMLATLLPGVAQVIFTRSSNPRAMAPETLAELAGREDAVIVDDPKAAVERAKELAGRSGAVLATGSIYLIADLVREPGMARASII
jgi:dihydrofolate synthase/folylpolyglutamate synthase